MYCENRRKKIIPIDDGNDDDGNDGRDDGDIIVERSAKRRDGMRTAPK